MTTEQLAFPAPTPPEQWGLIVDEVLMNVTGAPVRDWWATQGLRFLDNGRARVLDGCIAGLIVEIGPLPTSDAEFLRGHILEKGCHAKTLKLRRWIADLPPCTREGACEHCGRSHWRRGRPASTDQPKEINQ